jgi:glutathione synthase/RimK-type ligase-like ATP-grasp enzyme
MKPTAKGQQPAHNAIQEQPPLGLARLMTMAFHGVDLAPLGQSLLEQTRNNPNASSANALMDVAIILHLKESHEIARAMQQQALEFKQLYQLPAKGQPAIRLLTINVPGDLSANTPVEFLVEDSDIELNMLYVAPNLPFPEQLPEHDVMFVAVSEKEYNLTVLKFLEEIAPLWPRPVLNLPDRIARLSRDSASALLHSAPGVIMPVTSRVSRETLQRIGRGEVSLSTILKDLDFPIIVRPLDSHAGRGLIKADDAVAISKYLETVAENEFFVARFVDYRSDDGLFRKYRVVLIDGRPYASHMAVSDHWMIHYLNAGMDESAEKRSEEARFMADFDLDFASRHGDALHSIAERTGLDYLVIDCAQAQTGQLLIFEVDSSAVVHAMDPVEGFPYKKPQMHKVFSAFRRMLVTAIERRSRQSLATVGG